MKTLFYACFLTLFSQLATAQNVPNNGFENWATTANSIEKPVNWQTTDDLLGSIYPGPAGSYFDTKSVTKSSDAHGGRYAARLSTVSLTNTMGATIQLTGYMALGNRVRVDAANNVYSGLPYTARPTQMQFYYKLTGPGAATDQPGIQVLLTRTTNGTSQIIGGASTVLTPTTGGYALGTLTLSYTASTLPDSVTIYASSGNVQTPQAGTTLLLDDISFLGTGLAVRADASLQELLSVAPNPSPAGRFVISSPAEPALAAAPLTVLDVTGRVVVRQPAQAVPTPERTLDLSGLSTGIYLLRLDSKHGALLRQLVVK